eukprot:CAMPEP_0119555244 /NCGR_PEP_ID=MMETSP1352-20130426/7527_1 /TAXON_ID=265584 /ORGANISM="Stauroneis constricta, Strain CCMP1120" /LENGTH=39 /DNA_ID= /DNA_START= /DNA_END= /DNA_ORIENTATION=
MTSRKIALSPAANYAGRGAIRGGMSTEYIEALQVMNDAT